MGSPPPPCAWLRSVLRRSRPALRGLPSASPIRSFERATDRQSSPAVGPSSGFSPGRLARLHGRLSWVFWPPSLRAFSAWRAGTFAGLRRPARGVSSRAGRLPTSPPEGFACRRRWTLARHLSCAFSHAAEVACARRSRVCFAVGGRVLLRSREPLSRSLVRRRTARQKSPYARAHRDASRSPVVHSFGHGRLHFPVARLTCDRRAWEVFPTAIHSLWKTRAAPCDDAHSRRRARANLLGTPLSAIQCRDAACDAELRDRHASHPRAARICPRHGRQAASGAAAPRRWTRARFGLIVPLCRWPSTRSCRAPRK